MLNLQRAWGLPELKGSLKASWAQIYCGQPPIGPNHNILTFGGNWRETSAASSIKFKNSPENDYCWECARWHFEASYHHLPHSQWTSFSRRFLKFHGRFKPQPPPLRTIDRVENVSWIFWFLRTFLCFLRTIAGWERLLVWELIVGVRTIGLTERGRDPANILATSSTNFWAVTAAQ